MNDYQRIEKAINYIEKNFKNQPTLDDLANELHLSKFHLQKLFKKWAGISPKKFLELITLEHSKKLLAQEHNIIGATYDSGLSSTSRLHELYINIEAMSPKDYASKGKDLIIYYGVHETQFGFALIGVTEKGICTLQFIDSGVGNFDRNSLRDKTLPRSVLQQQWPNAKLMHDQKKTKIYIDRIFTSKTTPPLTRGGREGFKPLNIFLKGTNFQIQVWRALLNIPASSTSTYEQIAKSIKHPKALRAVGTAVGKNPISFLIPCHRVIKKTGAIGNYRWGATRKKAMLAWEGSVANQT